MESRFIENYCIGRDAHYSRQVTPEWLADSAASIDLLIDRNIADHQETREAGPYTGPSGIATSLMRAVGAGLLSAERGTAIAAKYRNLIPTRVRQPVYLCGALGDIVASLHLDNDEREVRGVRAFLDYYLEDLLDERVADEILYGRAGALMAGKEVESITGQQVMHDEVARRLIDRLLANGRKCVKDGGGGEGLPPLLWCWHKTQYLGAAHGVAGVLQSLLHFWQLLSEEEKAEVKATCEWMLSIEERDCPGHWESSVRLSGSGREKRLVHWCHGATGMVGFLLTAHRVLGQGSFLEAAQRAGELIWHEGVLKKGPGVCHGVGGNGLALLQVYAATGDDRWLTRAKCFAVMMMDQSVQRSQRTPDAPESLFEGWAGGLALLTGIAKAEREPVTGLNAFPFMPVAV
ncbi:hypothetical protein PMAYCL1PPCAC_19980 [Pristionchus mayeri]|uniref:Uncharacterized protein n=1 Tax=Pristionchus mayeri TaxID=1317129 RepID=A0AAN5I364_9BILA|nr:hypothetical protein PMAYCL1PPCAC_19980 [Pristionchus mayeri]